MTIMSYGIPLLSSSISCYICLLSFSCRPFCANICLITFVIEAKIVLAVAGHEIVIHLLVENPLIHSAVAGHDKCGNTIIFASTG